MGGPQPPHGETQASKSAPVDEHARLERIFGDRQAPFAFVDLDALRANADYMLAAAAGKPLRVATKSLRCRPLLQRILAHDERLRGVMTLTLPEALWLYEHGLRDLLVAYPWTGARALEELARVAVEDPDGAPVLMVDCAEQLDLITGPVSVCIDLDVGWWPLGGRVRIGPKRSPIRKPEQAQAFAREIASRPPLRLVGAMAYEGQIAGVADRVPGRTLENLAVRALKRASAPDVARRRGEIVAAIESVTPLRLVNGGGTGSVAETAADPAVTEIAAGSGFYAPMLFQYYRRLALRPAAGFALPIVRRPGPGVATALGGGYVASGPPRGDRQPVCFAPAGLKLDRREGAGEAQTPLIGAAADLLRAGDRVYLRHAKAGELSERFNEFVIIEDEAIIDTVPTYRGEGLCFL